MDLRCPRCGAKLRGRELWCSLCHADLRPRTDVAPAAPGGSPDGSPGAVPDPLTAPVDELLAAFGEVAPGPTAEPTSGPTTDPLDEPRGKHARPRDPGADGDDLVDPEVMLAMLRADSRDPVLSKVGGRLDDPTARFLVMVGGTVALAAVLFAVYAVLGLVVG